MRVLIVGMNGFTGQHIKKEMIDNNHEVIGLKSDLRDADAVSLEVKNIKPDSVINLASVSHIGHANPSIYYDVNLIGTMNLLHALNCDGLDIKAYYL